MGAEIILAPLIRVRTASHVVEPECEQHYKGILNISDTTIPHPPALSRTSQYVAFGFRKHPSLHNSVTLSSNSELEKNEAFL